MERCPGQGGLFAKARGLAGGEASAGAGRSLGCPRQWGTSHRWPFDLTTNGLFSISEMGPAAGSQGRKVARHRGLPAWFHGWEFAQQLHLHTRE